MTATPLAIGSEEAAWEYITEALQGNYDNEVIELNFDNWPIFHINIKGDRYNSTMTTSLMRSLVELQGHLYRVYAEFAYGKNAKSLSAEERAALEIVFKVEEGSSNVIADLSGFFTELGKNAMEKMTGKQIVTAVIGVAALFTASSAYNSYTDSQHKALVEINRHEITEKLLDLQPKLLQIQSEQKETYTNILKSVPDAEKVTLGTTELSRNQIETITRQERQKSELTRLDDTYKISSLKIKQDSYKIDIIRTSDGKTIVTELQKNHLTMQDMKQIMTAFTSESPIKLNIVARAKGDIITTANIVGINDRNEEEENLIAHAVGVRIALQPGESDSSEESQ